jgi:predicted RND superfamily exporter protein
MITLIVKTQISSLLLAFSSVFIILSLLFASVRTGFYTTVPIVFSTVFIYALMGLSGVTINMVTVIIVNTCIGIGIDYAIHFTSGYLYCRRQYPTQREALLATVANKGAVIIFNTMVVGAGFLILVFSSFPPIRHFGGFIFLSMVTSTLFSLIFLPVFFLGKAKNTKAIGADQPAVANTKEV